LRPPKNPVARPNAGLTQNHPGEEGDVEENSNYLEKSFRNLKKKPKTKIQKKEVPSVKIHSVQPESPHRSLIQPPSNP